LKLATILLAAAALPCGLSAQVCRGGPVEPGAAALGGFVSWPLNAPGSLQGVEMRGQGPGGMHAALAASRTSSSPASAARFEANLGMAVPAFGFQWCPLARAAVTVVNATTSHLLAGGLAGGILIGSNLSLNGRTDVTWARILDQDRWTVISEVGGVWHGWGLDVQVGAVSDLRELKDSLAALVGIRFVLAPFH
jgi:hypothetical protein